jgi:hypothetical protein
VTSKERGTKHIIVPEERSAYSGLGSTSEQAKRIFMPHLINAIERFR